SLSMPPATQYLRRISDAIVAAQRPIRILKALNWDAAVHERFFREGTRELPDPAYAPLGYDPEEKARELRALKRQVKGKNRLWASRPRARQEEATLGSAEAAAVIRDVCAPLLGGHVKVHERARLTANAAAGATSIAVKKGARFTPRQARALAHHEGLWHVLTARNGAAQPILSVLSSGLRGYTESQEGGGIVSEYLTGNVTNDRFIELAERTLAVDRAARGADYLDVWRDLASRWGEEKACHLAERVFRGGVLTGGAPFTKDAVYQRGYCRVYNFLR